jgi:hypothetical protein
MVGTLSVSATEGRVSGRSRPEGSLGGGRSESAELPSLYVVLAEEAPAGMELGETRRTAQKETIDNDREALVPGLLDG